MRGRRRARNEARSQASNEAQAALALAARHADAGWQAQRNGSNYALTAAADTAVTRTALDFQTDVLRVLEVVTRMCDNVIAYIDADRVERRLMLDTLGEMTRSFGAAMVASPPGVTAPHERLIGGSMDPGPEAVVDVCDDDRHWSSI